MNKAILTGRLVADPEVRSTTTGKTVATYTLAVNRRFKQEGQPEADFLKCVAWNKSGEFAGKNFTKGMKVDVIGSIQTRSYDGNDGKKVYVTEIVVDEQEFGESKKQDAVETAYVQQERKAIQQEAQGGYVEVNDCDLPF